MDNELTRIAYYYLDLLLRKPLYWLVPAAIVFALGAMFVFSKPRTYYTEALMVVESQQIPSSLVESTVANERTQFIEQRVLVRENLLTLVNKLDLFPGLRSGLSNTKLAELVRSHIKIRSVNTGTPDQNPTSSTFYIGFEYSDPQLAAAATSELVSMIIEENRRTRTSRASEATQFLEREVSDLATQVKTSETSWAQYMEQNKEILPGRVAGYLTELQDKERDLTAAEKALPDLEEELRLLEVQFQLNAPLANSSAANQRTQLTNLKAELSQKSSIYSDTHPDIVALKSQIQFLENQIAQAGTTPPPTADTNYSGLSPEMALVAERIALAKPKREALIRQRDQLRERVAWLRETIARAPEVEAELATRLREKESIQRSLDDMKAKLETARLGQRLEQDQYSAQIRVLEQPETPRYSTGAGRTTLMFGVLALAGLAGLACVYVSDLFDRTIRRTSDLASALQGQVLVVIPQWSSSDSFSGRVRRFFGASLGLMLLAAGIYGLQPLDQSQQFLQSGLSLAGAGELSAQPVHI
ncbi:MAG: hypothetical protein LCH86_00585 [Proteobacteria bacterium]|nr:hypothetical protein [Pseudomonadota bacterium]